MFLIIRDKAQNEIRVERLSNKVDAFIAHKIYPGAWLEHADGQIRITDNHSGKTVAEYPSQQCVVEYIEKTGFAPVVSDEF